MNKKGKIAFLILLGCFVLILPFPLEKENAPQNILGEAQGQFPINAAAIYPSLKTNFNPFVSQAVIAFAVDLKSGRVLYDQMGDKTWPTASLAKLMTAIVTVSFASTTSVVEILPQDLETPTPVMGLKAGEKIRIENLLKGMLISSSNDAANVLSRVIAGTQNNFSYLMNLAVKGAGLKNTNFKNSIGLDDPDQYSTAEDLTKIAQTYLNNDLLAGISQIKNVNLYSEDRTVRHYLANSNKLLGEPGILGLKTGFTDNARGNLIVVAENLEGNKILTVVLGSEQRENDTQRLIDWIFSSYNF